MSVVWVLVTGAREFWRPEVVRVAFDAIEADYGWRGTGPHTFALIHGACPLRPVTVPVESSDPDAPASRTVNASADMLADAEARRRRRWHVVESRPGVAGFPAQWGFGRGAGHLRNRQMISFLRSKDGPKEVVGFPLAVSKRQPYGNTPGTSGCLQLAEEAGLRWWVAPLDMDTDAPPVLSDFGG